MLEKGGVRMAGRQDYEERKERKIERYQELAEKSREDSKQHYKHYENMSAGVPFGQPILVDHYSANTMKNRYKKMNDAIDKSIEADKKAKYYEDKIDTIENNKSISLDDPQATAKLQDKLERLENERKNIKARPHSTWELQNIGAEIRRIKDRIKQIEELEELQFNDIEFTGGKAILNKEVNRIQILFDDKPSEEVRNILKHRGFKWSRYEKAWQRLFNKNSIYATNRAIEEIEKNS